MRALSARVVYAVEDAEYEDEDERVLISISRKSTIFIVQIASLLYFKHS